jgi:putative holliday junction resolvase
MPRCLGIDFGLTRVGLAVSDKEGIIAQPIGVIIWKTPEELISEIKKIVTNRAIEVIVIGNPIHLSGDQSEMSLLASEFAKKLHNEFNEMKIVLLDERLSSAQAARCLREAGEKPGRNKPALDAISASLILQSFLEAEYAKD